MGTKMIQFEAGKTYFTRSICDSECIVTVAVVSRTAKTIQARTAKGLKTLRIFMPSWEAVEKVRPWGSYSMAPIVGADRVLAGGEV